MAAEVNKPDFSYQWSSGGSIVAPSNVKIQTGWTSEVPPFQWENYLQNRQDNAILHLFQKGISEWDAASNYYFTASGTRSYVQGSDGLIYVAVQDSVGQNPTTDVSDTYWKIAFADNSTALTTATGDARYAQRANNLSDLANVATARNNLNVYSKPESEALLPLGYFYGFTLANNVTLPNTTIDVGVGQVKTSDNLFSLSLLTPLSGILQASGVWAAGNNQNKLDTGARANNTWYNVFIIRKTSDGTGDILFSASATAPTMPTGYAGFRLIESIKTNASGNIIAFRQVGGEMLWVTPIIDVTANVGTTSLTYTISTPPGRRVIARVNISMVSGDNGMFVRSPEFTDLASGLNTPAYLGGITMASGSAPDFSGNEVNTPTDLSSQVALRCYSSGTNVVLVTYGWKINRV